MGSFRRIGFLVGAIAAWGCSDFENGNSAGSFCEQAVAYYEACFARESFDVVGGQRLENYVDEETCLAIATECSKDDLDQLQNYNRCVEEFGACEEGTLDEPDAIVHCAGEVTGLSGDCPLDQ